MGAWTFVDRKLEEVLVELGGRSLRARYIGRPEAASPATAASARITLNRYFDFR